MVLPAFLFNNRNSMTKPSFFKLALVLVAALTVAGVGYAGLVVWRERASMDTKELVSEEKPTREGQPTIELPSPTEVDAPELATSGWKTYRNEEYGFEFRYPGKWRIPSESQRNAPSREEMKKATTRFEIYLPDSGGAPFLEFYPPDSRITFTDFVDGAWGHSLKDKPEVITVEGNEWYTFEFTATSGRGTFNPHRVFQAAIKHPDGGFIKIEISVPVDEKETGITIFHQLLLAFRFIR